MKQSGDKKASGYCSCESDNVSMQLLDIAIMAASIWKLNRALLQTYGDGQETPLRVRVPIMDIQKIIENVGIEIIDLTGRMYDPGFATEVVAYEPGISKETENLTITEMLSPIIMLNGRVLIAGKAVLGINSKNRSLNDQS